MSWNLGKAGRGQDLQYNGTECRLCSEKCSVTREVLRNGISWSEQEKSYLSLRGEKKRKTVKEKKKDC